MLDIECKIEGVTPLICNRFTDEAAQAATTGSRGSIVGNKGTPQEQAEKKLYTHNGHEVIPQPNIFRAFIDAGKYMKAGKSKVTTQKSSLIPACVSIPELVIPIEHKQPWKVDTRPVRIPSTGGRILAHRPSFDDWALKFTIELDEDVIDRKVLREIVDIAGKRIGLGDFRPDCKGPYGKFKVTLWNIK